MSKKKKKNKSNKVDIESIKDDIIKDLVYSVEKPVIAKKYNIQLSQVYSIFDKNKFLIASEKGKKMNKTTGSRAISKERVNEIYEALKDNNYTIKEICDKFGISRKTVYLIQTGTHLNSSPNHVNICRNKGGGLTKERVKEIEKMLKTKSIKEVAKETNLSVSTVARISSGKHYTQNQLDIVNVEQVKSDDIDVKSIAISDENKEGVKENMLLPVRIDDGDLISLPNDGINVKHIRRVVRYKKMGMVADRHNMPTDSYVFDNIDQDLMFDYDRLYDIAKEKILSEVMEDGRVISGIAIYVTGLTCALGAITKICNEYKINLILLHYNNIKREYMPQIVFDGYINGDILPFQLNGLKFKEMYTYDCTINEFINRGGGYEVSECVYDPEDNAIQLYRILTLFKTRDEAWWYYISTTNTAIENSEHKNIYLNKIAIKNNLYHKDGNISKSLLVQ